MANRPRVIKVANHFEDTTAGDRVDKALSILESQFDAKLQQVVSQLSDLSTDLGNVTSGDFGGLFSGSTLSAANLEASGTLTVRGGDVSRGVVIRDTEVEFVNALLSDKVEVTAVGDRLDLRGGSTPTSPSPKVAIELRSKGNIVFTEAGNVAATEEAWIEVDVSGTVGYIRVYLTR